MLGRNAMENPLVVLEYPLGVWFPLPTKGLTGSIGHWGPSAREGVFAGYKIRPGYQWAGQYLVWDLRDFIGVSLQRDTGVHNIGLRSPHQSSKVELYNGELFFPLKARYDRVNATLEGVDPSQPVVDVADGAGGVGGRTATDSPTAAIPPDVPDPEPKAGSTGPDALGIYFDPDVGHYKLDKRGRRYPVDETGTRKFRFSGGRVTARPEGVSGELWSQMTVKERTKALEELAKQTESALPGGLFFSGGRRWLYSHGRPCS